MTVASHDIDPIQDRLEARFKSMGLEAHAMADGRAVLATLDLGPERFESIEGPVHPGRIVFATVGATQIKCLRPRALFGLPLIDIRSCKDAPGIEHAIRQAWKEHTRVLAETRKVLQELDLEVSPKTTSGTLGFTLPGESPSALVRMREPGKAILPSMGPLSGIALQSAEERVVDVSDCLDSAAELEGRVGQRIAELVEAAQKRAAGSRLRPQIARVSVPSAPTAPTSPAARETFGPPRVAPAHQPKVLLVGPQLSADAELRAELENHGYHIAISHSESEALSRLASMSPELILSQYTLGRTDGASFVATMTSLAGIERIPVVLIDDTHHASRREAARAVGAAGYMIEPREKDRFVARLARLVAEPGDRRFTRYSGRLAARLVGVRDTCLITEVGRGGVFMTTQAPLGSHAAMRCQISLPELGRNLEFEGEVLYNAETQGGKRQGLGVRFFDMSTEDETALIQYLGWLESQA